MTLPHLKNEAGLSDELLKSLIMDFRKVESIDSDLPDQIVKYIVDGDDADFPVALSTASYNGIKYSFSYNAPHGSFLRKYDLADTSPLFRLAQVYDAMAKNKTIVDYFYSRASLSFPIVDLSAFVSVLANAFGNQSKKFEIDLIEKVFVLASEQDDALVRAIFFLSPSAWAWDTTWLRNIFVKSIGFTEFVLRQAEVVREALNTGKADQKIHVLEILKEADVSPLPFAREIAALACSTAKTVRNEAALSIKKCGQEAAPFLQEIAQTGVPLERINACKFLFEFGDEKLIDFLKSRLETEKSAQVRETLDELLKPKIVADKEFNLVVPSPPEINPDAPLSDNFLAALREAFAKIHEASLQYYENNKQYSWAKQPKPYGQGQIETFFRLLQNGTGEECNKFNFNNEHQNFQYVQQHLIQVFHSHEVQPIHLVRLVLMLLGRGDANVTWLLNSFSSQLRTNPNLNFGIRELGEILKILGIGDAQVVQSLLHSSYHYKPLGNLTESDENLWHYLFDKQDELEKALFANDSYKVQNALSYLGNFPQIPPRFRAKLWEFALGKTKAERALAQKCLKNDWQKSQKLLDALQNRSADVRAVAAEWLGNSAEKSAIEPLREALKQEKSDAAKDQMLRALEKLGASVEEYLDRDKLAETAKNELKNAVAKKTIAWLNPDLLPKVAWADTKEAVALEILTWFIVQTVRQKQIEISPLLRRYFEKFEKAGCEKFGQFALESWIAADTQPFAPDEAEAKAKALLIQAKNYWKYYEEQGYTEDSYFQENFNRFLKTPRGSASKEKGMLAIAAACCSAAAVPPIERYIREFHGHRLKQSQALVQVLGELDDLSAIQVLLSLANRFRTKGIQEEAKRQVDLLAERNNWTLDELADRTIPTLGFDEKGELLLDYGSRKFTAKLDKEFDFLIFDETGKKIKSLPPARKEDDPELVKDAKQTVANAKKNLKQVLALQRERLHEAMCNQRSWKFGDWHTFLNVHPILRRYCHTLVWQTVDTENELTFRPLDDGTLTDAEDEEVKINDETLVKLAHQQTVSKETAEAWQTHLSDYEVAPIFAQFNREMPEFDCETLRKTALHDFEGWMIETFKLRGKATALGYKRGQAEDAGWFYYYKKTFPSLNLEAFVEFTGNYLPEENRNAALVSLSFARTDQQTSGYFSPNSALQIKDVPPVILCETWNDIKTIAQTGSGFDADWKKKSEY